MPADRSPSGGGPIHLVQVTRHRQLLEQYDEYRAVAQRLREELLETVDQLREIQVGDGARDGEEEGGLGPGAACWDERTVLGARAWAEDVGVSWRALRVSDLNRDDAHCERLPSNHPSFLLSPPHSALASGKTRPRNSC